ncbi:MAG: EcsC family protein [Desulfovibrionaceae bacterium]|nr:EcsC family protein [Desulfovibrionaceae bacterium]
MMFDGKSEVKKMLSEALVMQAAGWAYDRAVEGSSSVPGLGSAYREAEEYQDANRTCEQCVDSLVRWTKARVAASGFVLNLGGAVTLPAAIPADLAALFYQQMRMAAAIAWLCGERELHGLRVRTLCLASLAGDGASLCLDEAGLGKSMDRQLYEAGRACSGQVLTQFNRVLGAKVLTRMAQSGLLTAGRFVPLLGGFLGAGINVHYTAAVARAAKGFFLPREAA